MAKNESKARDVTSVLEGNYDGIDVVSIWVGDRHGNGKRDRLRIGKRTGREVIGYLPFFGAPSFLAFIDSRSR